MRGARPHAQPVVRQEGAPRVEKPARQPDPQANVIQFVTRAPTAKPHPALVAAHAPQTHVANTERAMQKAQRAAAALEWTPDRTEPTPRFPDLMPMPEPQPPQLQARASVPSPVVAEGSKPVAYDYVPPAPLPRAPTPAPAPVVRAPEPAAFEMPVYAPPPQQAPARPASNRWQVYEQLGLGEKKAKQTTAQQWMVTTYRTLGFGILTIIVVVLVSYIMTTAFYFWNNTWIQPMVVSPTDEKVLALQSQAAAQMNERDRIQADLSSVERELAVEQDFQSQFAQAIRADLEGRKMALSRARSLAYQYASARGKVQQSNQAYATQSAKQMKQEYKAGLIDRSEMLSGKFQLAQITTSNLGLAEREAEFETRAGDLDQQAKALEGLLSDKGGDGALSYDVLRIKQEYETSRLATARAMANREALRAALGRQKTILDSLAQQPYLRALADKATVAFVPYGNLGHVAKGTPLYSCSMEMFWCHEVGKVREILPGEVQFKHPHKEKMLRGQLVELDLDAGESDVARKDTLFLGSRPLWL